MKGLLWTLVAVGVPLLVVLAILGVVGLMVGMAAIRWWLAMRRMQAAMAPAPVPPAVERWAAGAYSMWTGGEDCATWDPERARQSLQSWYGATDATDLMRTISGLATGEATDHAAWDQVRAVDLVRIGMAAGYLSTAQGHEQIRALARALRARYRSWEEACAAFEAGMHAWQDSRGIDDPAQRGRVQRNLILLRAGIWPQIDYDAAL